MTGLTPSYGSMNVDWENRIDVVRLREQRLARLSAELERSSLGPCCASTSTTSAT
jgi:hypothetical protein